MSSVFRGHYCEFNVTLCIIHLFQDVLVQRDWRFHSSQTRPRKWLENWWLSSEKLTRRSRPNWRICDHSEGEEADMEGDSQAGWRGLDCGVSTPVHAGRVTLGTLWQCTVTFRWSRWYLSCRPSISIALLDVKHVIIMISQMDFSDWSEISDNQYIRKFYDSVIKWLRFWWLVKRWQHGLQMASE
jgi:hypothetical protein